MAAVGNLVDTIAHNLKAPADNGESFYQRGCWTNRLDRTDCRRLREVVKKFLAETDEKAREILRPFEQPMTSDDQVTAGVSLFYFEEEPATRL